MAAPTIRGQGNGPFNQARPTQPVRRGQSVPYDVNGKPQGPIAGALADGTYGDVAVSSAGTIFTVAQATKLRTTRTLAATGDVSWSGSFDGSANFSVTATLATVNANTGTFGGVKTSVQVSLNGKGLVTSASAITIQPDYSNVDAVPTGRFLGRVTAATGFAEALTVAQAKTLLALVKGDVGLGNVDNTSNATERAAAAALTNKDLTSGTNTFPTFNQNTTGSAAKWTTARSITMTGDVSYTVSVDGSAAVSAAGTIANDAVTYAKMQNVSATNRFLGRITAGAGDPEELTAAQAKTILGIVASDVGSGAALTKTDDTNVTLTLGGTPAAALLAAASITVGWTGILAAARGGTANGFFAVSGPATSLKTFTLPNANDTIACLGQAQSFTASQTITKTGAGALILRSGAVGSFVYIDFARTAGEGYHGIAGATNDIFSGTAAGEMALRGANALHLGAGDGLSAAQIKISGTTIAATGTLSVTGASNSTGNQLISGTGAQGYATGSGGAVTQITSKATGVTLSKTNGQIVTTNAALAAAAVVSFVVTNTTVAATDTINLCLASGNVTAGTYRYWIDKVSAGSFVVAIENRSAGSLSEALTFNFAVVKAVTS